MYFASIVLLMAVLPLASILLEHLLVSGSDTVVLIGRWFVFWAGGARLAIAGLRQIGQPSYTARTIFEIADPAAGKVVVELGFANLALGVVSLCSIVRADWVLPAAVVAGLYYGLAGIRHVMNAGRNRIETWATVSDLLVALVFASYVVLALLRGF
jgi:hypothetical protein